MTFRRLAKSLLPRSLLDWVVVLALLAVFFILIQPAQRLDNDGAGRRFVSAEETRPEDVRRWLDRNDG